MGDKRHGQKTCQERMFQGQKSTYDPWPVMKIERTVGLFVAIEGESKLVLTVPARKGHPFQHDPSCRSG